MRFWKYLLVKSNIRYLARSFALSLSLSPSLPLFSGLVSASALLLSQNIKGSSPTCWPLWSMFCVSLCVFAFVSVCEDIYMLVHVCICASVSLFVCVPARAHMNMCVYILTVWGYCLCVCIKLRACVYRQERGFGIALVWPGRGKKSVWVMGQRVHGNGSHLLRGKAAPEALIDKPINL